MEHTWPHGIPLWFYLLKEAEHRGDGDRLDPASYLSLGPGWPPTLPAVGPRFGLTDLLTVGIDCDERVRPA